MTAAPRFAFLGTPPFAATILQALVRQGWRPVLVVTEPAKPVGRDQTVTPSAVAAAAAALGLSTATPASKDELLPLLSPLKLDVAVVAAYGKLIPTAALGVPTHGMVNVHASLLPAHRGASPIQAAILAGDPETGISFMRIEPAMDTGPVIRQVTLPLAGTETAGSLTKSLAALAADTIVPVLKDYLSGSSQPVPQDGDRATYAPKLHKEDAETALRTVSAVDLDRKFRAFSPWPGIYSSEFGPRLILRRGRLDGGRFVLEEVQWEGKRPVDIGTFGRSYPEILTKLLENRTLATPRT